jgi:hypothetical protein
MVCGVPSCWIRLEKAVLVALDTACLQAVSYLVMIVHDQWYPLATEGSIRGRGLLFGLEGGLFRLCLTGCERPRGCSIEGDVTGDTIGDLGFGDT